MQNEPIKIFSVFQDLEGDFSYSLIHLINDRLSKQELDAFYDLADELTMYIRTAIERYTQERH